ncbi:MAG: response regulator transcription factor [Anaerolineae bacterium]|nr:response regulator transcription factor [Anaerolineae bacterium]
MNTSQNLHGRIRILIVDDHAIVRKGLAGFIEARHDLELVAEAANGAEAIEKARQTQPDVIIMDLVMPEMDGITAITEIKNTIPAARVLVLTSFGEDEKIFAAIQAGAQGYLLKDSSPEELVRAIQQVYLGESYLHPIAARRVIQQLSQKQRFQTALPLLTKREREILTYLAQGYSNQEIAQRAHIGEKTVRFHVSNILAKLNVETRTQAALWALGKDLTPSEDDKPG